MEKQPDPLQRESFRCTADEKRNWPERIEAGDCFEQTNGSRYLVCGSKFVNLDTGALWLLGGGPSGSDKIDLSYLGKIDLTAGGWFSMNKASGILAIGEKKLIGGKWYEKAAAETGCRGCAWKRERYASTACNHPEVGGTDCHNSIWIACDQPQPETPAVEGCAGCRYWLERGADTAGDILGSCRRNPPQVYRDDYGDRFPLTWPHDWCGEWKA